MSLAVKNLDYEIGNERILDQISLEIKEGEFVGLVGPNGCGKSTLLKHIYRTYKPKGQTVFLDGKDIMDLSAKKLAGELAVMAQENQLEFDFTVRDMVMFGRYAHKKFLEGDTAKDRELCEKCLREVGLSGYETRSYLSLSGGEKQRVLLARVLMQESRYIVLDEPTNHLDVSYQYQIMDILRNQDVTVFSSIHDLNLAALYCDRIIFLYQGKIVDRGTPEEVLTKENIRKVLWHRSPGDKKCSHREDADLLSAGVGEGKGLNRNRGQICLLDGTRRCSSPGRKL
ncbi:MAG: ABC transporter ATP-binding protein [Lachnospiraceae bacterium]